jgi:hypothetical protein
VLKQGAYFMHHILRSPHARYMAAYLVAVVLLLSLFATALVVGGPVHPTAGAFTTRHLGGLVLASGLLLAGGLTLARRADIPAVAGESLDK